MMFGTQIVLSWRDHQLIRHAVQRRRTWTQEVAPPAPMPSSLIMASVMRLSALPPPPPPPLVSVVTPAAAPPPSYLHSEGKRCQHEQCCQ